MSVSRIGRRHAKVHYNNAAVNKEYWKVCGGKGARAGVSSYMEYDGDNKRLGRPSDARTDDGLQKLLLAIYWMKINHRFKRKR